MFLALENRFIFAPVLAWEEWVPPPPDLNIEDLHLTTTDGNRIHAWWMRPSGWEPRHGALLYCHGNAGNLSNRADALRLWRDLMHMAVLIFDYPGYGHSSGVPTETGCYSAADAAYDRLTNVEQVPGERLLLYGASLGGAIATDVAVHRPHRGLVLVATFTSLSDMAKVRFPWLPARWLLRSRFDSLHKIADCHRPVFIAHGTADRVIPYFLGERLFAAAHEPKEFYSMTGLDHHHAPPPDFYRRVSAFLARTETRSPTTAAGF